MKLFAMPDPKVQDLSATESVYIHDYHVEGPDAWKEVMDDFTVRGRLNGPKPIRLIEDTALGKEAYKMQIAQDAITVLCGGKRAARYALNMILQAARRSKLAVGVIEDYPMLDMRGYHLNLNTLRYTTIDDLCHFVRMASAAKINTLLIEYDTRFPYKKYGSIAPWALTDEEYKKLHEVMKKEDIDVIPLVQTCGHLDFILSHPDLAHIREEHHKPDQLCPTNPDSMTFVKELVDMYAELHPESKYFHIGGDETRQLGICPECADYVHKHGKGGLYTYHMNQVIDYVCSKGLIPLVYDDMVCAHREAMKDLDRRAVIIYWDYWTTTDPSPLVVARGGGNPHSIVHDSSHVKDNYAGIADLERNILRDFTGACDMVNDLSPEYLATYQKYLGEGFPRMMKAYPYLEYYQDQGFKVITMPTTMGNTDNYLGAPNQARFTANVMTCAKRTKEAGAEGMIASAWYPFPEAAYPYGIALTGQYAWGLAKDAAVTVPGSAASV